MLRGHRPRPQESIDSILSAGTELRVEPGCGSSCAARSDRPTRRASKTPAAIQQGNPSLDTHGVVLQRVRGPRVPRRALGRSSCCASKEGTTWRVERSPQSWDSSCRRPGRPRPRPRRASPGAGSTTLSRRGRRRPDRPGRAAGRAAGRSRQIRYVTDSNGVVAFDEPGLIGLQGLLPRQEPRLRVPQGRVRLPRQGARDPAGGLGHARRSSGSTSPSGSTASPAGGSIATAVLTGGRAPIARAGAERPGARLGQRASTPSTGARSTGSGATPTGPGYPLGNFHVPGATSELPGRRRARPRRRGRPDLLRRRRRLRPADRARCPATGPTWIGGLVVLRDRDGRERMFADYVEDPPAAGDLRARAGRVRPRDRQLREGGHVPMDLRRTPASIPAAIRSSTGDGGIDYVYYRSPYPLIRVPADPEALADPGGYEAFTCLAPGTRLEQRQARPRRRTAGLRYAWKRNTPARQPGPAGEAGQGGPAQARGGAPATSATSSTGKTGPRPTAARSTGTSTAAAG